LTVWAVLFLFLPACQQIKTLLPYIIPADSNVDELKFSQVTC